MRLKAGLVLSLVAGAASAQPVTPVPTEMFIARASICAPGPQTGAIAARAVEWGWTELPRKDALKLQLIPDKSALVRAWRVGSEAAPAYLLVQTPDTPPSRRLTCEVLTAEPDSAAVQALLGQKGFGEPLGEPRLRGALPTGGRYLEWAAPEGSPWRLITLSVPAPPKKGAPLTRIGFSGVER